jgi:hypothetical protein
MRSYNNMISCHLPLGMGKYETSIPPLNDDDWYYSLSLNKWSSCVNVVTIDKMLNFVM